MRFVAAIGAVVLACSVSTGVPLATTSMDTHPSADAAWYPEHCATGRLESTAANLRLFRKPDTNSDAIGMIQKGDQINCQKDTWYLGGRYTACGVSQANGWIRVFRKGISESYVYMTCVRDVG